MKYIVLFVYLILQWSPIFARDNIENNPIKYIPKNVSFVLYLNSIDKSFDEFKDSYFWKKYKNTDQGKELDKTFNSIDASFFAVGLTLNDLLEIFSKQALLGVWLENNKQVRDYIYIIEKKKNKKLLKNIIERLEYFAVANKIAVSKYKYGTFNIIDFAKQIFISNNKEFLLISNNVNTLNDIAKRIDGNIVDSENPGDFKKHFQNRNIVFYIKKTNVYNNTAANRIFYSFRFKNKPELETLFEDKTKLGTNFFNFENDYFKMMPSDINCIFFGNKDIRTSLYPFFTLIGTNMYTLDKNYFDMYFNKIDFKSQGNCVTAIKYKAGKMNVLQIKKVDKSKTNHTVFNKANYDSTYNKVIIYKYGQKYFALIKNKEISSDDIKFLEKSIYAYKKSKNFYFTKNFKKLKNYRKRNPLLWMNLHTYLTDKSMKFKKGKWSYYNAYIKTFDKLIITSKNKEKYFYSKLFFY